MDDIKLIKVLREEIKLRGYSKETEKSYVYNVGIFLKWIDKHNKRIVESNIREYLLELEKKYDSNSIRLSKASIVFFFEKCFEMGF